MGKWILRLVLIGVVSFVGYVVYDSYRGGFFSLPDIPDGQYPISFSSGLRAILVDPEVSDPSVGTAPKFFRRLTMANKDRRYLGIPFEVAPWFQDAWSICTAPTDEERTFFLEKMPSDLKAKFGNSRLDGVCRLEIDGKQVLRGLVYSVPHL
jgi:hypothetical protein